MKKAQKKRKEQDKQRATLKKNVDKLSTSYAAKVKERNETETGLNRTKPLNELDERYETLKRGNE